MLHTSAISQKLISDILKSWQSENLFNQHIEKVSQFYKDQRDIFHKHATSLLGNLAEWNLPTAGMFFWIKILNVEDTTQLVSVSADKHKVLFVPGKVILSDAYFCSL